MTGPTAFEEALRRAVTPNDPQINPDDPPALNSDELTRALAQAVGIPIHGPMNPNPMDDSNETPTL